MPWYFWTSSNCDLVFTLLHQLFASDCNFYTVIWVWNITSTQKTFHWYYFEILKRSLEVLFINVFSWYNNVYESCFKEKRYIHYLCLRQVYSDRQLILLLVYVVKYHTWSCIVHRIKVITTWYWVNHKERINLKYTAVLNKLRRTKCLPWQRNIPHENGLRVIIITMIK